MIGISFIKKLIKPFVLASHRVKWRKNNKHNSTHAVNYFTSGNVTVGNHSYGPIEILYDNGTANIHIGHYCSIANNVKIFGGGVHDYQRISTFPFQTKVYNGYGSKEREEKLDICIEDDVWIGYDCIILPGTYIGKGSVIGARSVVTGSIPAYSVYVGNKVIKRRFSEEIIKKLEKIDYSSIEHSIGDSYQQYCTSRVTDENVDLLFEAFSKK